MIDYAVEKIRMATIISSKKNFYLGAWLFCVFVVVVMTISFVRDGEYCRLLIWRGDMWNSFRDGSPMIKYVRTSYHCMRI